MSAILSPCGTYRYRLDRDVAMSGPVYAFFGVNPSTADATVDDATVRKWTGFVKRWGGRRFIVGNVWPRRSTDVKVLATAPRWLDVMRENEQHILRIAAEADTLVPCWGDRKKVPRVMHNEFDALLSLLRGTGKPVMTFGLTAGGDPKHPLMLGYDTPLVPLGVQGGGEMSMDAPTMDVLRKQAIAMAMLWFTARDYQTEGGHAWFHIRARDLGLREDVLPGMKIAVRIDCEPDGTAGVRVLDDASSCPQSPLEQKEGPA